jgi:hypothetical protein
MIRRMSTRDWLALLPVAMILVLVLALSGTAAAAPAAQPEASAAGAPAQQDSAPVCKSCHATEDAAWQTSTHATAGAKCESCHGAYKEGHPNGTTMTLPLESETCRGCHESTFADWENSQHGDKNVDCFDCHLAHSQGLRLEPQEKLCSACHTKEETQLAHNVHGISGINCVSCHMSTQTAKAADGSTKSASSHTFTVASDICAGCHSGSLHGEASTKAAQKSVQAEEIAKLTAEQGKRISELEAQINADQQQVRNLRNIAVVAMGLSLGVGGAMGLIVGIAAATLVTRRKQQ